ncbi:MULTISPECIES: CmpA/NrtA family ABC transporter substrate-binding protein [unclassified Chelatococcus]|uniref:CmpA/NrtA family ABC transporter substrate-binding protein n=1 Tax=unclassified Chelatococcus TaxID=2638111 RepID=UPI0002DD1DF0|nr:MULTISPECIES: CmpA/NrtA family ABC transporter substrate-binding protein [unclassified Chelatococcus]ALA18421.1 bicarbonate-binding protein [Chelatococcus sp. CO-6]
MKRTQTTTLSMAPGRRAFLKGAGATATFLAAKALLPAGAHAAGSGPEVTGARLGYIALTDSAPLIIAKEKGFFAKYEVPDVAIEKQASWGATRDNMALGGGAGGIDGGHILRPKVHLYSSGAVMQNGQKLPMYTLLNLNEDCQGISVAQEYAETGVKLDSGALKEAFARKKASGKDVTAAMTFPGGTHDLWIRYWLAAGGIDPDKDLNLIVVPPPQMVANMKVGNMDCFCVGEPWNEQLVNQKIGFTATTTGEIWFRHPEKVLGMRADWVDKNPKATLAILMALMEAQQWCEKQENKQEMAEIIGRRQWYNVPVKDIIGRIKGDINYGNGRTVAGSDLLMKFWGEKGETSYPWKSLDTWFMIENIRWGKFPASVDVKAMVDATNRSDLWLAAAKGLGLADLPAGDSRGVEKFFDGKTFDPENPSAYLDSLAIKAVS